MSKLENLKNHLRNNKVTYVACGVTAVVVAGVTYYVTKSSASSAKALATTTEYVGDTVIHNAPSISGLSWKPTVNVINFVENSTPSKRVGVLDESGNIRAAFNSIGEAARQTGLDKGQISKVVNGLVDKVGGQKFVELPAVA